jgi:hypothetical protein
MAAVAPIVVNDGQATPVAHTFTPAGPDRNGVQYYKDVSGGIAIGFPQITIDLREPRPAGPSGASVSSRVYRATVKVVLPILENNVVNSWSGILPSPTKSYDLVFRGEFLLPERSQLAGRKDLFAFVKNLMADTVMTKLIQDLENVY